MKERGVGGFEVLELFDHCVTMKILKRLKTKIKLLKSIRELHVASTSGEYVNMSAQCLVMLYTKTRMYCKLLC